VKINEKNELIEHSITFKFLLGGDVADVRSHHHPIKKEIIAEAGPRIQCLLFVSTLGRFTRLDCSWSLLFYFLFFRVKYTLVPEFWKFYFFSSWVSIRIINSTSILKKYQINTSLKFSVQKLTTHQLWLYSSIIYWLLAQDLTYFLFVLIFSIIFLLR
jgi:hypothetical protein